MKTLSKGKIIASVLASLVIISLAGGFAYLKFIEGKLHRSFLPSLTTTVEGKPVNMLLLGSDSRGEKNARSDTMIIMRYDPEKEKAYLVSIPRDSRVNIEGYGYRKINAATALGGPNLAVKTVKKLTGLDIHHYVMVDFSGFKNLVDALGGIEIDVPKAIENNSRKYRMHIPAGKQEMNGTKALNYVRFRHDARSDIGRIERQQVFFKALSSKMFQMGSLLRAPYLINVFAENIQTDMGGGQLLDYSRKVKALKDENIMMTMAPGTPKYLHGASYVILHDEEFKQLIKDVKAGRKIKAVKAPF